LASLEEMRDGFASLRAHMATQHDAVFLERRVIDLEKDIERVKRRLQPADQSDKSCTPAGSAGAAPTLDPVATKGHAPARKVPSTFFVAPFFAVKVGDAVASVLVAHISAHKRMMGRRTRVRSLSRQHGRG
jgi:hypothetical protein